MKIKGCGKNLMKENFLDHFVEMNPNGLTIVANKIDIRHDINVFIEYIKLKGIKRTHRDNLIPKADLLRLARIMGDEDILEQVRSDGYSSWISNIDELCRRMKFIKYDTEGEYAGYSSSAPSFPDNYIKLDDSRIFSFFNLSLQKQENKIQACMISESDPCASEFFSYGPKSILDRFDRSGCATGMMKEIDFPSVRRVLLSLLAPCVSGKWYSVKSLVDFIKTSMPYFLIPEKVPKFCYGEKNRYHNFMEQKSGDHWPKTVIEPTSRNAFERVEGRYVERFLEDAPLTMGYVELAYDEKGDLPQRPSMGRIRAFKVTDRFRQAIQQQIREPVVTVLPNFEIHVESLFYPVRVINTLLLFCDFKGSDIHTIMKLSRKKVIASLAADDLSDPVKSLRELTRQPLPGNVVNELESWSRHAETFLLYKGFSLLEGKGTAKYIRDYIVEKASPDIHIIRSPEKVYRQLETAQQVPLLIKHPEAKLKSPGKGVKSVFSRSGVTKKSAKQSKRKINVRRSVVTTLHFSDNGHFDEFVKIMLDMGHSVTINKTARTVTFSGIDEAIIKEALKKVDKSLHTSTKISDKK